MTAGTGHTAPKSETVLSLTRDSNAAATFLSDLGRAYQRLGDPLAARAAWTEALTYFEMHGHARAAEIRRALAASPAGA